MPFMLNNLERASVQSGDSQVHASLYLNVFWAGPVATAAMAAMLGFRKDTVQLLVHTPTVLHVFDLVDMRPPRRKVVDEADLHAILHEGLAGKLGLDLARPRTAHHAPA